ncbi:hypothetical protein M0802_001161 [Mischocyttarus mexicanus]|nr:hypothetical protein M0802_001161 [Mischocyttarus mexicanus]
MKILCVLIAIAVVTSAIPFEEQNYGKGSNVDIDGDWYVTKDGILVPIFEPVPAKTRVEVGAECHGSKCGGSIKVGVDWFKSEEGRIVAVPSTNSPYNNELSCNAGHCIGKYQVSKVSQSGDVKQVIVDWFKTESGSLVGVPRPEEAKIKVGGEVKCQGRKCSGSINVGGDWFNAGDGVSVPVPQSVEAKPYGTVEVGAKCDGHECSGNIGVKIEWFEDANGNLIPNVVPQPAGGKVEIGAECSGSKCGGSVKVGIEWFVAPNGVIVLNPKPAGAHVSGGIQCSGSHCSGNIGVGVDWFKKENNNVVPVLTQLLNSENNERLGEIYRFGGQGGKIPIIPIEPERPRVIHPKSYNAEEDSLNSYQSNIPVIPIIPDVPRLVDPKSYNAEELYSYTQKIILERGLKDPKRPVDIIVDSNCNQLQIKGLKCKKETFDILLYRLTNGEIVSQVNGEDQMPENISITQISPTTARIHVSVGGKVRCKGFKKCKGHVNIGVGNRKRRDLADGFIQEIYRANLIYYTKEGDDESFDFILAFPQSV